MPHAYDCPQYRGILRSSPIHLCLDLPHDRRCAFISVGLPLRLLQHHIFLDLLNFPSQPSLSAEAVGRTRATG
ncbi:colanic acid biosynthesis glycosyltransferase WcaL [Sesbania bispinosa]|nr:colanic acid biosynthesis glycosyltransferase WcaL [Sesbania bispinosa]